MHLLPVGARAHCHGQPDQCTHQNGGWILLQNIHLTIDWTSGPLKKRIDKLGEGAHREFRCTLSEASCHAFFPILSKSYGIMANICSSTGCSYLPSRRQLLKRPSLFPSCKTRSNSQMSHLRGLRWDLHLTAFPNMPYFTKCTILEPSVHIHSPDPKHLFTIVVAGKPSAGIWPVQRRVLGGLCQAGRFPLHRLCTQLLPCSTAGEEEVWRGQSDWSKVR